MNKKANPEGIKWPTNKARYDKNYLRLYGKPCPHCGGTDLVFGAASGPIIRCFKCGGIGYVGANSDNSEKPK